MTNATAKLPPPYIRRNDGESVRDCLLRAADHPLVPKWQADSLRHDADRPVPMDVSLQGVNILCTPEAHRLWAERIAESAVLDAKEGA